MSTTPPSLNVSTPASFDTNNFSLLYGIIALALFVVVLIICTFIVLCYFRCMARSNLQRQQLQRQRQLQIFTLNERNSELNEGYQVNDTIISNDELNTTKPPVYENILDFSPADKLPTYNSYRQVKERNIPTAALAVEVELTNRINDHPV
jgi:hypothetical protein